MWRRSRCTGPWLHRFVLRRSFKDCQEEICQICKLRIFTKVREGRIDNFRYLSLHLRSALQRYHPRFKKEYANTKL